MKYSLLVRFLTCLLTLCAPYLVLSGATLEVGPGKPYSSPAEAAVFAQPGDTILIFPAIYTGSNFIANLHGTAADNIYFIGVDVETVLFQGGSQGLHFSQVSYLQIKQISISGHTLNGINMDDGGTFDTPSHHILISHCRFYDMAGTGNHDFLKLSGIDHFEIAHCTFVNGAAGGSAIDMVGCHEGLIRECFFENMGSNCIQAKGGTQFVEIRQNRFEQGGFRTLNLGGSTGLEFFRPQDAPFEAADIDVYANVFIGSTAPIAYVGCVRVHVVNNTIITPGNWVIRILQETVDPDRFLPCGDNSFVNNIVYYSSISTHVNIGPNTNPNSFVFANNLWYRYTNPGNSAPNLPVTESDPVIGQDPLFMNFDGGDFSLSFGSPAIDAGTPTSWTVDFEGNMVPQGDAIDIGAYEFATALTLELIEWNIQVIERQLVILNWQINDIGVKHTFTLERSSDAENWDFVRNIYFEEGKQKSTRLTFETEDNNPFFGISYYRLTYYSEDGTSGRSPILKAYIMDAENMGARCYPNPFGNFVLIKNDTEKMNLMVVTIYNQYGVLIETHHIELESKEVHLLQTHHWASGVYFLNVNERFVQTLLKK